MKTHTIGSTWTNRTAATLSIQVAPDPRSGKAVRTQVIAFAEAHQICDEDLREFLTAMGEALANAIEHAGSATQIQVNCRIESKGVLVGEVIDAGIGFLPPSMIESRLPDAMAERGRGLGIMRRCSDFIDVASSPGQGTKVTFRRYLRGGHITG